MGEKHAPYAAAAPCFLLASTGKVGSFKSRIAAKIQTESQHNSDSMLWNQCGSGNKNLSVETLESAR
jgi:hypothetical protein